MRRDLPMRVFIFSFCMAALTVCIQCQKRNPSAAAAGADTTLVTEAVSGEESAETKIDLYARLTYGQRKGKLVFEKYCAVCHGT